MNHVGCIGIETWVRDRTREADRQTVVERESGCERERGKRDDTSYVYTLLYYTDFVIIIRFVCHSFRCYITLTHTPHTHVRIYILMCVCG